MSGKHTFLGFWPLATLRCDAVKLAESIVNGFLGTTMMFLAHDDDGLSAVSSFQELSSWNSGWTGRSHALPVLLQVLTTQGFLSISCTHIAIKAPPELIFEFVKRTIFHSVNAQIIWDAQLHLVNILDPRYQCAAAISLWQGEPHCAGTWRPTQHVANSARTSTPDTPPLLPFASSFLLHLHHSVWPFLGHLQCSFLNPAHWRLPPHALSPFFFLLLLIPEDRVSNK